MALSASKAIQGSGGVKNQLLHGSDIPKQFDGVVVKVKAVREAPVNFSSPFILDFQEPYPYGCKSWGMNLTNTVICQEKIGDDLEALIGKRIYLRKIKVNNPKTDEEVVSLTIGKIEGEKPARVDTQAKAAKPTKPVKTAQGISEKDLPF